MCFYKKAQVFCLLHESYALRTQQNKEVTGRQREERNCSTLHWFSVLLLLNSRVLILNIENGQFWVNHLLFLFLFLKIAAESENNLKVYVFLPSKLVWHTDNERWSWLKPSSFPSFCNCINCSSDGAKMGVSICILKDENLLE